VFQKPSSSRSEHDEFNLPICNPFGQDTTASRIVSFLLLMRTRRRGCLVWRRCACARLQIASASRALLITTWLPMTCVITHFLVHFQPNFLLKENKKSCSRFRVGQTSESVRLWHPLRGAADVEAKQICICRSLPGPPLLRATTPNQFWKPAILWPPPYMSSTIITSPSRFL
jgi:hypothetical protein